MNRRLAGVYAIRRGLDAPGYTSRVRCGVLLCLAVWGLLSADSGWAAGRDIQISAAWARPTPPAVQVGAVYFSITNRGGKDDVLQSVSTAIAGSVEIHATQSVRGVMQMRPVTGVNCPAGATVTVAPGGLHVMLLGLRQPLIEGSRIEVILRFRDAGALKVEIPVQNAPTP